MRIFYALVLMVLSTSLLNAQSIELGPVLGNPYLKSYSNVEQQQLSKKVEKMTGQVPDIDLVKSGTDCPPDVIADFVLEAETFVNTQLDTFDMGGGIGSTIECLNCDTDANGTANFFTSNLVTQYIASPSVIVGRDTVLLEFCNNMGVCDTISYTFFLKRKGREIMADPMSLGPDEVAMYCLDDELDFPGALSCSEFVDCIDPEYDGEGQPLFHFTNYNYADTCIVYYATRFPGTDNVCIRICDENAICDIFTIPFTVTGSPITNLPIFDDFSYDGPRPTTDIWLDKDIYVNNTLAPNPPSIGMATFDGLNRKGDPYPNPSGVGDRLTSRPIDLSNYDEADNIFLKFYAAPKGWGLAPSAKDSLMLEFKNNNLEWEYVTGVKGFLSNIPLDSLPPFQFYAFPVEDDKFFHDAFQFRFTTHTSPGGMVDLWHLDYVRFALNETTDTIYNDIALTYIPSSILKNYQAIPWNHFLEFEETEIIPHNQLEFEATFFNQFADPTAIGNSAITLKELTSATNFNLSFPVADNFNVPVREHITTFKGVPQNDYDQMISILKNIPFDAPRILETTYSIVPSTQSEGALMNDTAKLVNYFDDYFAYDDGTAERSISFLSAAGGEQLAVKYHTNVDDTLRAIRFLFPHINGDVQSQFFHLYVRLDDIEADNAYENILLRPYYANNVFDTLQGFTTYRLENSLGQETPLFIPGDSDFFVIFEQVSSAPKGIPIGYDVHHSCESCNFFNTGSGWDTLNTSPSGVLMVRPLFSAETPPNTSAGVSDSRPLSNIIDIYPNPVSDILKIQLKEEDYYNYHSFIFNVNGQLMMEMPLEGELNLEKMPDGMYFLKLLNMKTGESLVKKIMVINN